MYKFIIIRHDIIKQCLGNYKEMKKFNFKLEIEISRNSTLKHFGVLRCQRFGCPKRHPDALLAKTMSIATGYWQGLRQDARDACSKQHSKKVLLVLKRCQK